MHKKPDVMTEITFHFNVPDKLHYTCRLLRTARRADAALVVTGEAEVLQALDGALWNLPPQEFMAHATDNSTPSVQRHSPVVLCHQVDEVPHHHVLVNLGQDVPTGFSRFERLNEIIGLDEHDRIQGRRRWRYYADRGYTLKRHDLAGQKDA